MLGNEVRGREKETGKGGQPVSGRFQESRHGEWLELNSTEASGRWYRRCASELPQDEIQGSWGTCTAGGGLVPGDVNTPAPPTFPQSGGKPSAKRSLR